MGKLWAWLKSIGARKWWYALLFVSSTIYVTYYRFEIYDLSSLNAHNLIFIVWLALLIFPLLSEIELLGIKLKKEVEKAKEELNASLQNLQTQLTQLHLNNTIPTNINFEKCPLPSEHKIEEMLQKILDTQAATQSDDVSTRDK
jgi:hypothetical protein